MRGRPAGQNARPALSQALEQRILAVPLKDWAWMIGLAFWRAAIAGRLGLGVDEAHYVLYGLRLDLSYFDHPPLVGWIHALAQALFGISELSARLPAIACGLASSIMSYRLALRITGRPLAARAAALALNASFLAAALWLMFLPDTILAPLALWLVEIGARLVERGRRRDWIELGICLGLCGLTKYTAIFFVGSLLGLVASERAWRRLRPGRALAAAAIAAALVAPVFIWNQAHNWISFKYQSGHVPAAALSSRHSDFLLAGNLRGIARS
jgi:4-amino-4-deoxy-L-arabinose transferase-like glycosyltransferase